VFGQASMKSCDSLLRDFFWNTIHQWLPSGSVKTSSYGQSLPRTRRPSRGHSGIARRCVNVVVDRSFWWEQWPQLRWGSWPWCGGRHTAPSPMYGRYGHFCRYIVDIPMHRARSKCRSRVRVLAPTTEQVPVFFRKSVYRPYDAVSGLYRLP
jgi:hypothetical protein